jgi:hypothetical protein
MPQLLTAMADGASFAVSDLPMRDLCRAAS